MLERIILVSSEASIPLVSKYVSKFSVVFFGSKVVVKVVRGVVNTSFLAILDIFEKLGPYFNILFVSGGEGQPIHPSPSWS